MTSALVAGAMLSACGGGHDEPYRVFSSTVITAQGAPQTSPVITGSGLVTYNVDDRRMIASLVVNASSQVTSVRIQEFAGDVSTPSTIQLGREGNTNVWSTDVFLNADQAQLLQNAQYYFRTSSAAGPANNGSGQILEQFPADPDWNALVDASETSPRLRWQLEIVDEVAYYGWDHSGVGLGLTFGF